MCSPLLKSCSRISACSGATLRLQHTRRLHQSRRLKDIAPAAVAEAFLQKFANGQSFIRKQVLDKNQLRLLSLTLDRNTLWPSPHRDLEQEEPTEGTPLPPGYHLAYFTPSQLPGALGIDGTDTSYNPNAPFTRRMWAGGSIQWPGANLKDSTGSLLRVGDEATEITRVVSCEPKVIKKTGESMLVVGVVKEFLNGKGDVCVVDNRNWVFREALDPSRPAKPTPKPVEQSAAQIEKADEGKLVKAFRRETSELFRFSALTFNAHRIHYDKPWAINVEGHRDTVVHGPLNMISILDFWRDAQKTDDIIYPKSLEYRATSPIYVEEPYRITMNSDAGSTTEAPIEVVSNDGTLCMKGKITRW